MKKKKAIEEMLGAHAGEIDRQLAGTGIAACAEDRDIIVDDYPLLPIRRRFWEHVLRAVDVPGTASQLRTQLKIVHEAVHQTAEAPLGHVVPGDFIFNQLHPDLLRGGILLREIDETIRNLDDGTDGGRLAQRLCGLIFLIRKLGREAVADIGVRATPDMLADLLVADLSGDGTRLRKDIPGVLKRLVDVGTLIKLDEEYSLQTRESSEWDREFRNRQTRLNSDLTTLSSRHGSLISAGCGDALKGIRLVQGGCKEPRKLQVHFGTDAPTPGGRDIPVWVRDGWGEKESAHVNDARAAGIDSATIYVYVPKASAAGAYSPGRRRAQGIGSSAPGFLPKMAFEELLRPAPPGASEEKARAAAGAIPIGDQLASKEGLAACTDDFAGYRAMHPRITIWE